MFMPVARHTLLVLVLLSLASTTQVFIAQTPGFEVASVRLAPGPGITSQRITESRVDLTLINLRALLLLAFRAKGYELSGPDWLAETRVSIQATLPAGATRQQIPEMLQRLLAQRFNLVVHREPRPMEMYELVIGPGGHKMREVEPADELSKKFPAGKVAEQFGPAADTVQDTLDGPVRTVMTGDDLGRTTITPGTMYKVTRNVERRTQTIDATRITMAELTALLTTNMNQPVVDKTELRGLYQFASVQLPLPAREIEALRRLAFGAGRTLELPDVSESRAVQGLGLRLERRRSPVEVVVIDNIDRTPTDN